MGVWREPQARCIMEAEPWGLLLSIIYLEQLLRCRITQTGAQSAGLSGWPRSVQTSQTAHSVMRVTLIYIKRRFLNRSRISSGVHGGQVFFFCLFVCKMCCILKKIVQAWAWSVFDFKGLKHWLGGLTYALAPHPVAQVLPEEQRLQNMDPPALYFRHESLTHPSAPRTCWGKSHWALWTNICLGTCRYAVASFASGTVILQIPFFFGLHIKFHFYFSPPFFFLLPPFPLTSVDPLVYFTSLTWYQSLLLSWNLIRTHKLQFKGPCQGVLRANGGNKFSDWTLWVTVTGGKCLGTKRLTLLFVVIFRHWSWIDVHPGLVPDGGFRTWCDTAYSLPSSLKENSGILDIESRFWFV